MFTIERSEGAKILQVSVRTIDRHVRSGRIRSRKIGKKVMLHSADVELLRQKNVGSDTDDTSLSTIDSSSPDGFTKRPLFVDYRNLFEEAQKRTEEKDSIIRDLSYRLGTAESELKNSISLLEYKRTTFLLESTKVKTEEEKTELAKKITDLEDKLKKESIMTHIFVATS
jgi:excisionase family DNA binding protein